MGFLFELGLELGLELGVPLDLGLELELTLELGLELTLGLGLEEELNPSVTGDRVRASFCKNRRFCPISSIS
jgi:hypothetical protein